MFHKRPILNLLKDGAFHVSLDLYTHYHNRNNPLIARHITILPFMEAALFYYISVIN